MANLIDDLTVEYVEDGVITVKQIDKVVLTKGAWCTIIFKMQNWDRNKKDYGPFVYSIRRYQKRNDQYMMRSKFNISSNDQAKKIIDVLNQWIAD